MLLRFFTGAPLSRSYAIVLIRSLYYTQTKGVPNLIAALKAGVLSLNEREAGADTANLLVGLPHATAVAYYMPVTDLTLCAPCARTDEEASHVRAEILRMGVLPAAVSALAKARSKTYPLGPALSVLEAYAPYADADSAAAAFPEVRQALASLKLLEPLPPPPVKTEKQAKEDMLMDTFISEQGLPTNQEKAMLRRATEALQCCALLAVLAALSDTRLENATRLEVAQELQQLLGPTVALLNTCTHPWLRGGTAAAAQLQRTASARVNNTSAIITVLLATGGSPMRLSVTHAAELIVQRTYGPCECIPGRQHHTAVMLPEWTARNKSGAKKSPSEVALFYALSPPTRVAPAATPSQPATTAPASHVMEAAPVLATTVNPLYASNNVAPLSEEAPAGGGASN